MRQSPTTKPLGKGTPTMRGPRSSSVLGSRSGSKVGTARPSGSGGSGGKGSAKKGADGVSPLKMTPASTGATPSLSLNGLNDAAPRLSATATASGGGSGTGGASGCKGKSRSPAKQRSSLNKKSSPSGASLSPAPVSAPADDIMPCSNRVTLLALRDAGHVAPTPRKVSGKSGRQLPPPPPPTLDAIPGAATVGHAVRDGGDNKTSPPPAGKVVEDAPVLHLNSRQLSSQRVPPMAPAMPIAPAGKADPLPPLTSNTGSLGVGSSSLGVQGGSLGCEAPGTSTTTFAIPSVSGSTLPSANGSVVKRPMTLLERRSGRERNAMSISCLSTLSVETIQETKRDAMPLDSVVAAPIIRGWSRTVANMHLTHKVYGHRGGGGGDGDASASISSRPIHSPSPLNYGASCSSTSAVPTVQTTSASNRNTITNNRDSANCAPLSTPTEDIAHSPAPIEERDGAGIDAAMPSEPPPRLTLAKLCASRGAVKLVGYNLLADRLVTTDRYASCPPVALGEDYRAKLMEKELQHVQADILVFAEMSVDMFEKPDLLGHFLRTSMNYDGEHVVITDQYGRPMCQPRGMAPCLAGPSAPPPPVRRSTAPAPALGTSPPFPTTTAVGSASHSSNMLPVPPTSPRSTQHPSRPSSRPLESGKVPRREVGPSPVVSSPPQASGKPFGATSETSAETTPHSRKGSLSAGEESPIRRTEMEGVAVFYRRTRFELLERVPVHFNEVASADAKLTPYERKKLQAKSHNVALVCVLRDRLFPTHVYIVGAVHLIWQRVEAQLWQSRVLMQTMAELKAKYDVQWRDGKRTRAPSMATTPAKGAKHETCGHTLPSVFKREDYPVPSPMALIKAETTNEEVDSAVLPGPPPGSAPTRSSPLQPVPPLEDPAEQHAICLLAGDFNAERTAPTLQYLCEGYIPVDAPVMSYWRSGGGEVNASSLRAGSTMDGGEADQASFDNDDDDDNDDDTQCSSKAHSPHLLGTTLSGGSASPLTGQRQPTHAPSATEGTGRTATALSPPLGLNGSGAGAEGTNSGPRASAPLGAPATPAKRHGQQHRQHTAPPQRKHTLEGFATGPLWGSTDGGGFPDTSCNDKSVDHIDELIKSPNAPRRSPSPVHGNWCGGEERMGGLSMALMSEEADADADMPPPPPPAARRKKKPSCPTSAKSPCGNSESATGAAAMQPLPPNEGAVSRLERQPPQPPCPVANTVGVRAGEEADVSPCFLTRTAGPSGAAPPTPSKSSASKRRKLPGLTVSVDRTSNNDSAVSSHAGVASETGSSRVDGMNHSTAVSDAASSVLSNGLDGEQTADPPRNTLFTTESLSSMFHDAATRAGADLASSSTGNGKDSGRGDAEEAQPMQNDEEAVAAGRALPARVRDVSTNDTCLSRSNSSPSIIEESDSSVPPFFTLPLGSDTAADSVTGGGPCGVYMCRAPCSLATTQVSGPIGLPSAINCSVQGVAHPLRFLNAYDAYCRNHPHRVTAVNPSTNQEGKVLDHVLYEPEHVACASVLRLGELTELPTPSIPSDHYMVGVLLLPRTSLNSLSLNDAAGSDTAKTTRVREGGTEGGHG